MREVGLGGRRVTMPCCAEIEGAWIPMRGLTVDVQLAREVPAELAPFIGPIVDVKDEE